MSSHPKAMPRRVEVDIEHLVLEGFDARDQVRIRAALERELGLLAELDVPDAWCSGGHVAHIDAGAFAIPLTGGAEALGASVGATMHEGLSG